MPSLLAACMPADSDHARAHGNYLLRERLGVAAFLLASSLTLAHFVHNAWFALVHWGSSTASPQPLTPPVSRIYAPDAYRVAMPALFRLLNGLFPRFDPTYLAAGADFCCAFLSLWLLYRLAVDGKVPDATSSNERPVIVALYLAFLQFPLAWVVPWQRPETMPSALFLSVALFSVVKARARPLWFLLLFAATACQGFVRADVPLIFGFALVLLSFSGKTMAGLGSRSAAFLQGVAVLAIAAAVQAYLQLVRFPHLSYPPDTPMFQARHNLSFHSAGNAALALFPFVLVILFLAVRRSPLRGVDALAVLASALYLPLWFAVGAFAEVRIYVPFLLLLCMVAARALAPMLVGIRPNDPTSEPEERSLVH